jgi:hypothetical protein
MGTGAASLGIKRPGREGDLSPPSSVGFKISGAIPPLIASVVYWSEFLATDPEVLGSIRYLEEKVAAAVKKTEINDRGYPLR